MCACVAGTLSLCGVVLLCVCVVVASCVCVFVCLYMFVCGGGLHCLFFFSDVNVAALCVRILNLLLFGVIACLWLHD